MLVDAADLRRILPPVMGHGDSRTAGIGPAWARRAQVVRSLPGQRRGGGVSGKLIGGKRLSSAATSFEVGVCLDERPFNVSSPSGGSTRTVVAIDQPFGRKIVSTCMRIIDAAQQPRLNLTPPQEGRCPKLHVKIPDVDSGFMIAHDHLKYNNILHTPNDRSVITSFQEVMWP